MPYKKGGEAYKRSLERKKAKRRIARLEKELMKSGKDKERTLYEKQINTLREQISRTYERNPLTYKATGYTHDELTIATRNLSRTNTATEISRTRQGRSNFLTQQEINAAESYSMIGPRSGEFSREEISIFYRATQEAWEGRGNDVNRNKLILEYYGKEDLRDFIREVLDINKKAIEVAEKDYGFPLSGEEQLAQDGETDRDKSADYLSYVVSPSQYEAMQSYIEVPPLDILNIPTFFD